MNLDSRPGGFLDTGALRQLQACRETGEAHYKVAQANAEAVDAAVAALNKTNDIGRQQTELAEFLLNEVERDRRDAVVEAWTYKGLLAALLVGLAL